MDYISAPIAVDPEDLVTLTFDYLRAVIPGWEPADGNLDVWLAEAFSNIAAQVAEVAADVPATIFRYYGAKVVSIPPQDAVSAVGTVTITAIDDRGYEVESGTTFQDPVSAMAFQTIESALILPSETEVRDVAVVALDVGEIGNDIEGALDLIDAVDFIEGVTLDEPTASGKDAESDDDYMNRLTEELRLLSPRPILPDDFATLARRVPGIERSTALDGYDPDTDTWNNERTVTVGVKGDDGGEVPEITRRAAVELLEAMREVNFLVYVVNGTYSTITVDFRAVAWPGYEPDEVEAAAIQAVADFLSPITWGQPPLGERRLWVNQPEVRFLEVAQAIQAVPGLHYIDSLSINGGTVDVRMSGVLPLPRAGAITGSVTGG